MSFNIFSEKYIRPTPFNPQSSRAHMSYEMIISENKKSNFGGKEKLRVFDLAGAENPMAIMFRTFGFNAFAGIHETRWKDMGTPPTIKGSPSKSVDVFFNKTTSVKTSNDDLSTLAKTFIFHFLFQSSQSVSELPKFRPGYYDIKVAQNSTKGTKREKIVIKPDIHHELLMHYRGKTIADLCNGRESGNDFNKIIPLHYGGIIDQITKKLRRILPTDGTNYTNRDKNPLVSVFLYESFKRVIEGFYITRSLFSLRYAFTSSGASTNGALEGLKKLNVNSKTIAPFIDKDESMQINFADPTVGAKLSSFGSNPVPFVPMPQNRSITYKTRFLEEVLKKDGSVQYKNLIVGVVNGNPGDDDELRKQQQVAINYLKTLTPTGGSIKK